MSARPVSVAASACLLIALASVFSPAAAVESARDFAKCQKMLSKKASWLLDNADKARRRHDKKVRTLLDRHIGGRPKEAARIEPVIDRLVEFYKQDKYRQVLIDEPVRKLLEVENDQQFTCWPQASVSQSVSNNLETYQASLKQLEDAIDERLGIENVGRNEGLVAILFYAEGYAQDVRIDKVGTIAGGIRFGPVEDGAYFRVVKASAGTYRWHSIVNRYWNRRLTAYLKNSSYDFRVEPGKLNYTGALIYKSEPRNRFSTNVIDRTSVVLSLLESRYPELLDTAQIVNGLNSDNRFIDFYMTEWRLAQNGDDGG